jgi:hypothetical protein
MPSHTLLRRIVHIRILLPSACESLRSELENNRGKIRKIICPATNLKAGFTPIAGFSVVETIMVNIKSKIQRSGFLKVCQSRFLGRKLTSIKIKTTANVMF